MHLRKALLQAGDEIQKIFKRQVGMQAPDNVKFRDRFHVTGSSRLKCFFERHRIGTRCVFFSAERAQAARRDADVSGINVAIDVEVSLIVVHALANVIGQPADRQNVPGAI